MIGQIMTDEADQSNFVSVLLKTVSIHYANIWRS